MWQSESWHARANHLHQPSAPGADTSTHTLTHTYVLTYTHTLAHTYVLTYTHTLTHTYELTYTHTHSHTLMY